MKGIVERGKEREAERVIVGGVGADTHDTHG